MTRPDGVETQSQNNERICRGGGNGRWTLSGLLLVAALAGGCSGGGGSVSAGKDAGGTTPDAAVALGMVFRGTPGPCTEPHSVCVNATIPANMTARPTMLQIDLYADVPPTHPPDGIPIAVPNPDVQAGETVQLRMTDLGLTGSYHFLGLLFMPGGGTRYPVAGVDYIGNSTMGYPFTGEAVNLPETLNFADFN